MEPAPAAKQWLRSQHLQARAALDPDDREAAGLRLAEHGRDAWSTCARIACYVSVGTEPSTGLLLDGLLAAGVRVVVPVVVGDLLDWASYDGADSLAAGTRLGLRVPSGPRLGRAALRSCDAIVVPALAVDLAGRRLGRGRGYYDRTLAALRGPTEPDHAAPVVAIVYDDEIVVSVPVEPHDHRVDAVLTPAAGLRPVLPA